MKYIKNLGIIKAICYILVPMLVLIIILNAFSIAYYTSYEEDFVDYKGYVDTKRFADNYFYNIQRALRIAKEEKKYIQSQSKLKTEKMTYKIDTVAVEQIEANDNNIQTIQYNFYSISRYDILLISPNGDIITNVEKTLQTDTLEKIKQYISSKKYYWNYDLANIITNVEKLQYEEIAYSGFEEINESGYEIYTALKEEDDSEFYAYNLMYDFVGSTYETAPSIITISIILLIACMIYIIIGIGHKQGSNQIYTNKLDYIPYEIIGIIGGTLVGIECYILFIFLELIHRMSHRFAINTGIIISIILGYVLYITLAVIVVTTIRRIKANVFWKNTICYRFFKFTLGGLFTNFSQTVKLAMQYGGFILVSVILGIVSLSSPLVVIFLFAFWYYIFKKILDYMGQMDKIRQKIKNMYNGEIKNPLNEKELYGELKQIARELNDISGGLSNAIEEATKSERLKTELITNVSHDIKTPLTSIINYVDLMKQEEIKNPKIEEYLKILDSKSQRLKKLTEDLLEASKASSGNIKLTMENLNVKELIKQVRGEFEDRFNKKELEIIETFPEEDIYIMADSRYMYRVLENMYINISKYALENSRVYIDVIRKNGKIQIDIKNISKYKLNISVDELMQRFVRGETSRTTEGSGLGISIAKSLTELQKGEFNIYLDGDLFKVVIQFQEIIK